MLCRAALLPLSRSIAAAAAASAGRNRPARPIASLSSHCCAATVAALVAVAFSCCLEAACAALPAAAMLQSGVATLSQVRHESFDTVIIPVQPLHDPYK